MTMEKVDKTTLIIKHLPPELNVDNRVDLLQKLGAIQVSSVVSSIKKSSLTFAKFRTKFEAEAVLKNLHQKEILGHLLAVEFAKTKDDFKSGQLSQTNDKKVQVIDSSNTTSQRKIVEAYLQKLNSWTNVLDFNNPPPLHIRYNYPPPTVQVLRNICKALAAGPKLYTQVLHLMNKMNLPCPFSERFNIESDLVDEDFEETEVLSKASESELESDGGEQEPCLVTGLRKRRMPQKTMKVKIPKLLKQKVEESKGKTFSLKREEVFEKSEIQAPRKIELSVTSDLSSLQNTTDHFEEGEGFKMMKRTTSETDPLISEETEAEEPQPAEGCISTEELESNRISSKDFHLLPVFKNYTPGPPTCRLYIKNLSKTVQAADLEFIFNRYRVEEIGDQVHLFDVRLMQEGRMKGQAFVTLQNVKLAEQALKEVNGYILKGKAMVVQFARSSKPK